MGEVNKTEVNRFPFHFSPSAYLADVKCRMKTYWGKIFGGAGIKSAGSFAQDFGTVVHAAILVDKSWERPEEMGEQAAKATEKLLKEHMILEPLRTEYPLFAKAVVYAFLTRVFKPLIDAGWTVVSMEEELVVYYNGLRIVTRPDMILRSPTGELCYVDLKTTGLDQSRFSKMWEMHPQLNIGAWAYEQAKEEAIESMQVFGIHKGGTYKGSMRGPLIVFYHTPNRGVGKVKYAPKSKPKWVRGLITEYPGGMLAWIDQLPDEVIASCFPTTALLTPDEDLTEMFLRQAHNRAISTRDFLKLAEEWSDDGSGTEENLRTLIEEFFPRSCPEACQDATRGFKCDFFEACWNTAIARDPVGSGLFEEKEARK